MSRCALPLRGVNPGRKNSLPMAELRSMLAASHDCLALHAALGAW